MEERLRFVARLLDGEGMSEVCREFGISRKTGYKVWDRYRQEGPEAVEYPFQDRDVLVTACGRICMARKKINVPTVLALQRLAIKGVDDGIWLVSFLYDDLGHIDLEQRT
jgi:hypothetical protein